MEKQTIARGSCKTHSCQKRLGHRACAAARQAGLARVTWTILPFCKGFCKCLARVCSGNGPTGSVSLSRSNAMRPFVRIRAVVAASLLCAWCGAHAQSSVSGADIGQETALIERSIHSLREQMAAAESDRVVIRGIEKTDADEAVEPKRKSWWRRIFGRKDGQADMPADSVAKNEDVDNADVGQVQGGEGEVAERIDAAAAAGADDDAPAQTASRGSAAPTQVAVAGRYRLQVKGDSAFLSHTGVLPALEQALAETVVDLDGLRRAVEAANLSLSNMGYLLSRLEIDPATDMSGGVLVLDFVQGYFGNVSFSTRAESGEWRPFDARFFSERQLRRRFAGLTEQTVFDYPLLYSRVFEMNRHPDLSADVDLSVRRVKTDDGRRIQFGDLAFTVRENMPLHAAFDIKNTGTEATGDWRLGATLQHMNLTKADDVITFNIASTPDFSTLRSFAGSYYRPFSMGRGGAVTLHGGYSDIDARDVIEKELDVLGSGTFGGIQTSHRLIRTRRGLLSAYLGWVYREIEDQLAFQGEKTAPRKVTVMPASMGLGFSTERPDAWGGRNFLTYRLVVNTGGSDDDELQFMRVGAKSDYLVHHLQAARLQPVLGAAADPKTRWLLYGRIEGQYTDGALIPAEQKGVGGIDTVRGYPERDLRGDSGFSGTLELRTPLYGRGSDAARETRWQRLAGSSYVQLVTFADIGYVSIKNPEVFEEDSSTIYSAGLGLRVSVAERAQMRFDWGFPFEETAESESSGRGHVSLQVQF